MTPERKCENCQFFKLEKPTHYIGLCLRYPPQVYGSDLENTGQQFPEVRNSDWCGEFQAREDGGT